MTEIDYDTEFLEDGKTIELISIGLVADDGREYYAVNSAIDQYLDGSEALHKRITNHEWLMTNVVPHLPLTKPPSKFEGKWSWSLDKRSTLVKPRWVIANEVREFILAVDDPELWAWYGAYDHVALCQLWGRMIDLPKGVPMWTHDLKQEAERLGNPELPSMPGITEHNALSDAREVRYRRQWLREYAARLTVHETSTHQPERSGEELRARYGDQCEIVHPVEPVLQLLGAEDIDPRWAVAFRYQTLEALEAFGVGNRQHFGYETFGPVIGPDGLIYGVTFLKQPAAETEEAQAS